jgi:hypothetical protein
MRDFGIKLCALFMLKMFLLTAAALKAQPAPGQLADQIIEKNNERLSQINSIEITLDTGEGGMIPATVTRYIKRTEEGRSWLEPEGDDPDMDSGLLSGVFDDQVPILVSGASSITNESLNGYRVYKVVVDDVDLLNRLVQDDFEFDDGEDMEMEVKRATMWIDRDELIARKVFFEQVDENGNDLNVEITLSDYREHSGLPIAHAVSIQMSGIETQFTEEDIAEARQALRELERQLEQMPEAQREMIERQMRPQIERFEQMVESGEIGEITFRVTDVRVNQ